MSAPSLNPVSTYEQALWWLIQNVPELELLQVIKVEAPLPLVFRLVSDTYWVTPRRLRAHLQKFHKEIS